MHRLQGHIRRAEMLMMERRMVDLCDDRPNSFLQLAENRDYNEKDMYMPQQPRTVTMVSSLKARDEAYAVLCARKDFPWMCGVATHAELDQKLFRTRYRWFGCAPYFDSDVTSIIIANMHAVAVGHAGGLGRSMVAYK